MQSELVGLLSGVLGDSLARRLFSLIAERGKMRLRDLAEETSDEPEPDIAAARRRLDQLTRAGLIEEAPASIPDWSVYYITSRGLTTFRQLGLTA
jgi:hypothetical protein